VAVSLFSKRGFRGTTTKEIAQAAGVSEAMVFRHFATKEELYAAILDHKACSGDGFDPAEMAAEAIKQKDDRAVFESLALGALESSRKRSGVSAVAAALGARKTRARANVFRKVCARVYEFLGGYIRERQREGALIEMDPAIVVRCFIGMVMHHSLNNNLWDPKRRLLNISNEAPQKHFTDILLNGISLPKSEMTVENASEETKRQRCDLKGN
jgi:AcrR family transcriptional regulator